MSLFQMLVAWFERKGAGRYEESHDPYVGQRVRDIEEAERVRDRIQRRDRSAIERTILGGGADGRPE